MPYTVFKALAARRGPVTCSLLVLHNYDCYAEGEKEETAHAVLDSVVCEQLVVTMQREDVVELEGSLRRAFQRRASNAELHCVPDAEVKEMCCVPDAEEVELHCVPDAEVKEMCCSVEDVMQRKAASGFVWTTERVATVATPLQAELLTECVSASLRQVVMIHPALVLEKKVVSGKQFNPTVRKYEGVKGRRCSVCGHDIP